MFKNLFQKNKTVAVQVPMVKSRRIITSLRDRSINPPLEMIGGGMYAGSFKYSGSNRADFFRFMRDRIPIISAGIWTWVHLCATPQRREIQGDDGRVRQAEKILDRLESRIYPRLDGDRHGFARLTENFFMELFTLGKFAAIVHLLPGASGISHLEILDPYRVKWKEGKYGRQEPWLEMENGEYEKINPATFFHRTLISDFNRPDGIEPLAAIPFVVEIEQQMLEDMARSSHNSGTPRLQVKITPPQPNPGEDPDNYTQRINSYFEKTVQQFDELGPDDNLFTWSDVEITVIGGTSGEGNTWKLNREQVIEDVITGLKLFPWALGRSHGTTRNWIYAQYNLLMQIVDSIQAIGSDLAEWLMRLELRLAGNTAHPAWIFEANKDPFIVERSRARLMHLDWIDRMVQAGYISIDQGARELGYEKAYRAQREDVSK
ncbi:MAG: hypothetical protein P9L92_18740 [Candidatus Electryonea clarkiae]|nr:hypothetical protein [Candidatus Electryonea clarkiae]MDP8287837.1 hypothetical protein [Candidatus Electryonea clarkiae]